MRRIYARQSSKRKQARTPTGSHRGVGSESFAVPALEQLESVAERVVDIDPLVPVQRLVVTQGRPRSSQGRDQRGQVVDQKAGVGLAGRPEVIFDPEVH